MLLAIPSVSVVEHHVCRVIRTRPNTHQVLHTSAHANDRQRIENVDDGSDREQIQLRRHE